jgi:pyruvate dehydrogenase E2 component (dihydrolipoamide acetyltransferase)
MAEIETDKATMDYESFNEGTVLYLGAKEGEAVKVDDILAVVGKKGEDYQALLQSAGSSAGSGGSKSETPKAEVAKAAGQSTEQTIDTTGIKAEVVLMPKMSDTMNEGVIAAWHKKVCDTVKSGELLAEVETDKATMEYESYNAGTLLYIGAEAGKSVPVNGVLAVIGEKGADWQTLLKAHQAKASGASKDSVKTVSSSQLPVTGNQQPATSDESSSNGRVKASPLAKKMAKDKGNDISKITVTGENFRVTRTDVENYKQVVASVSVAN